MAVFWMVFRDSIVERSFMPGKSVKDLLIQRLISEKKKDDAKKNDDFTEIA